jgi:lipopolysaccharide cholinephosphotransferase
MTTEELKSLQNKILEIVNYFDDFCQKNDIVYYLMGGSALGAMRHSGFIPWDDDFDVFMDTVNYKKFLNVVNDKLDKDRFYFQLEDSEEWPMYFSKIRMHGTTFIEEDVKDRDMHHGIYIDIMCLNNSSEIKIVRYMQYRSARILNTRALVEKGYISNTKFKTVALTISKYIINGFIKNSLLGFVRSFNKKNCNLVGHFFGRAPFLKTSFPKDFLGKPRYVKFEDMMLPVPSNVEGYLEVRYGERYMDIPSEKVKALYPSHAYIVDTFDSYEKYIEG